MSWWIWSLVTVMLWGLWGVFTKLALVRWNWLQLFVLTGVIGIVAALGAALAIRPSLTVPPGSWLPAILAAGLGLCGTVTFYLALQHGKTAIVIPFTAAYPVVTVLVSIIFLREPLRLQEVIAIGLFVVAGILVSH